MLSSVQDLIDDCEIISKEASSGNEIMYRFVEVESLNIREYIQPYREVHQKDIRFDKIVCCASEVRNFVKETLKTLGYEYLAVEEQLHNIAYMLLDRFRINRLNCRMELIYSDKCRRFHIDNVYLRSVTTLVGPGTELQLLDLDEQEKIHRVRTGDTVLIKGKMFPGEQTRVLHRSPKISHTGKPRVVFVMDY